MLTPTACGERKSWRLQQTAPGVFHRRLRRRSAREIWSEGRACLQYKLRLAGIALDFDETMTLRDDGSVIDQARVTKWGVRSAASKS